MCRLVSGHLLRGGQRQERREGLLRDQSGDRRDLHEGDVRSREARSVRVGGGGQGRCTFRQAQQQRPAQFRYEHTFIFQFLRMLSIQLEPFPKSVGKKEKREFESLESCISEEKDRMNFRIFCRFGHKMGAYLMVVSKRYDNNTIILGRIRFSMVSSNVKFEKSIVSLTSSF